jgi:GTP-binding protein EngB required for normal cell division
LRQGSLVSLGDLYDAHSESILHRSFLKTNALPPGCVEIKEAPGLSYKYTTADSLEEKCSSLDVSAELGLSALCGRLKGGWCCEYLSKKKTSNRVRQASTICITPTKTEKLRLEEENLKDCLDLTALHTPGATHIILSIEWGARTLITVKESTENSNTGSNIGGKLRINPLGGPTNLTRKDDSMSSAPPPARGGIVSRIAKRIGEVYVNGRVESENMLDSTTTALDFEIAADVANWESGGIPKSFDGVMKFLEHIPAFIKTVNDGKGVPMTFHLLPIAEAARMFNVELQHDTLVRRLDRDYLNRSIELLEQLSTKTRNLEEYHTLVEEHSFCVPKKYIRKAEKGLKRAEDEEESFKSKLYEAIVSIRNGDKDMSHLREILRRYSSTSDALTDYSSNVSASDDDEDSLLNRYQDKMFFADFVRDAGAEYIRHSQLGGAIARNGTGDLGDLYILHFNETVQSKPGWTKERQTLIELLNNQTGQYQLLVVDYDVPKPGALDKAFIQQLRCGRVIVENVTEHLNELAQLCLLRCQDGGEVDRSRGVVPPSGRRDVRIPCPGGDCFEGNTLRWACSTCRGPVSYGVTDEHFYCRCSRYLSSDAEFRCNRAKHGPAYARYTEQHLSEQLKAITEEDEYNILIIGRTGVGKSMFINALLNYVMFESLDDALAENEPLQYKIPCSFTFQDEQRKDHEVVVGKTSKWEIFSNIGKSSTQNATTYCFRLDGKIFRLIDTPGIGDTEGKDKDRKNTENILRMLSEVGKLNAILYLLPVNATRGDESFKACMSEILCRLHRDMAKRILFGFTNANGMNYTLGATQKPLDDMLKTLQTGISRGPLNQFFFDSMGFMYLATYKQTKMRMAGEKETYSLAWAKSAEAAHRLLERVYLDYGTAQDVDTTLKLNWADNFLSGMATPLSVFTESMRKTEKDWEALERKWTEKGVKAENLKEFNMILTVPFRYNLPTRRMVCCNPSCTTQVRNVDGHLETRYTTICHDNCTQNAPEGSKGHPEVQYCYPFRRWIFFSGWDCDRNSCKHPWKDHMKISYELRIKKIASDAEISEIQDIRDKRTDVRKERTLVQAALVLFQVYLSRNALGKAESHYNATVSYLDRSISVARQNDRPDEAGELERQKAEHLGEVKAFERAIDAGNKLVPDERAVEEAVREMKAMKHFGKYVSDAVGPTPTKLENRPFIWVEIKSSAKKPYWFLWSRSSDASDGKGGAGAAG